MANIVPCCIPIKKWIPSENNDTSFQLLRRLELSYFTFRVLESFLSAEFDRALVAKKRLNVSRS